MIGGKACIETFSLSRIIWESSCEMCWQERLINLNDQPLVLKAAAAGLQNVQKNFFEKYLYLKKKIKTSNWQIKKVPVPD